MFGPRVVTARYPARLNGIFPNTGVIHRAQADVSTCTSNSSEQVRRLPTMGWIEALVRSDFRLPYGTLKQENNGWPTTGCVNSDFDAEEARLAR